MAVLSYNVVRLPLLVFKKNLLIGTSNCNKRFIMTTRSKLDKVSANLQKNPFFDKYASKIAKLQETSPKEFLQRVENEERKLQKQKVRVQLSRYSCGLSSRLVLSLMKREQPWSYVRKCNFCDNAAKNLYITTPIFYVNGAPHIGHMYTVVLADAIARFNSMQGQSVFLCTGTDEHGTKIEKAAKSAALPILDYCTEVSYQYQEMCNTFHVEYSKFIRTTSTQHKEAVHHFWNCLQKNGHIYLGKYCGWYDVSEEAFLSDTEAAQKSSIDINGPLKELRDTIVWTDEDTYKFRLTSFKDNLQYWLKSETVVQPAKYFNTLMSYVDELQDLSISRPIKRVPWAIPTPADETHTVYVWLDALVSYLTSVGYPDNSFRDFWPPTIQIIGKDILKFHGIYWPAFLMAADLEPPKKLLCHGHWLVEDRKMSKSKGNVISPLSVKDTFTQEGLRYFLLRHAVPHSDANWNVFKVKSILNAELGDTLGNLVNRCVAQKIYKKHKIYSTTEYKSILRSHQAAKNIEALEKLGEEVRSCYEACNLHHAVDAVMDLLHTTNQMFTHHEPWHLSNSENLDAGKELEAVISLTLECVRVAALALNPIIPKLTSDLLDFLQVPVRNRTWEDTTPVHLTNFSDNARYLSPGRMLFFRKVLSEASKE